VGPTKVLKQPHGPSTYQIKQFFKHFNLGHAAGAQKFWKFGYRYPLCENTGIFPSYYKYLVFAIYTGFNK
jgi:hypothetical protein